MIFFLFEPYNSFYQKSGQKWLGWNNKSILFVGVIFFKGQKVLAEIVYYGKPWVRFDRFNWAKCINLRSNHLQTIQSIFTTKRPYLKVNKVKQCRSNPPEVFLGKGVLKICSKFIGEHPCQSALQIFWNHTLVWVFSC